MAKQTEITVLLDNNQRVIHSARKYRIRPFREALLIFLLSFGLISGNTLFIYDNALQSKKQEVGSGLIRSAKIIAANIDTELHQRLLSPEQELSDEYQQAVLPLRRALQANSDTYAFVYTMILKDGVPHFVLDATEDHSDDKSHLMDRYDTDEVSLLAALNTGQAQAMPEPENDPPWGVLISAYAPIKNKEGELLGVVGIDMKDDTYYERLYPIKRATIRTIVTGFFISFLIAAFVWFARNFSMVLNMKRWRLMKKLAKAKGYHCEKRHISHD
jgi:hypothetical protein